MFRQRIRDQYQQTWFATISGMPKLSYYCKFKKDFMYEDYLDYVSNDRFRMALTRLRLSSHSLEIETGRFANIDRNDRVCRLCLSNVVESEYNVMLCCKTYASLRKRYLGQVSWPSINMFNSFMSCKSKR